MERNSKILKSNKQLELIFIVVILSIACFLILSNLANHYLWQDEAQTALISKTILTHGVPLGYDGKNFFSQESGAEYGNNYIWRWHTWLPFYLVAGSFAIGGINTFSARFASCIFGIATIVLVYFFAKSLLKVKRIAALACILTLFSVPFLILSRQCRYYSMASFFSLLGLYSYINILENKKYALAVFFLSLILLFHVHYIYFVTLLATVLFHSLSFHKNYIRKLFLICIASFLVNIPWIIWFSRIKYFQQYGSDVFTSKQFISFMFYFLVQIKTYVFPPSLLLLCLIAAWANRIKKGTSPFNWDKWNNLFLLLFFCIFNLTILSLSSPGPFFRYLAPIVPVLYIIIANILVYSITAHLFAGIAAILILLPTNPILKYFYEITHEYNGPIKGIVRYLKEHGKENDIVAVTYEDLPLKFYTNMKVIGGLTGEDLSLTKKAKWIIIRKYLIGKRDYKVKRYLDQNIAWGRYDKITIDYPDAPFEDREDPAWHQYKTPVNEDRVVIYRRRQ